MSVLPPWWVCLYFCAASRGDRSIGGISKEIIPFLLWTIGNQRDPMTFLAMAPHGFSLDANGPHLGRCKEVERGSAASELKMKIHLLVVFCGFDGHKVCGGEGVELIFKTASSEMKLKNLIFAFLHAPMGKGGGSPFRSETMILIESRRLQINSSQTHSFEWRNSIQFRPTQV